MIAAVQDLYRYEPHLAARILGYWSNAFSAAVALCLLVSRAPFTCLSPAALQELERARILFRSAKDTCPRAKQVIPVLETMIDKANDIYNRWSNGQELPTIVLKHITDDSGIDTVNHGGYGGTSNTQLADMNAYGQQQSPYIQNQQSQQGQEPQAQSDSFALAHRSLAQCIAEVHERAKALFPLRKPCQCSAAVAKNCPPSHSWSPPPSIPSHSSPVLPEVPPALSFNRMSPAPGSFNKMTNDIRSTGMMSSSHAYSPIQSHLSHGLYGMQQGTYGDGIYSNTVLPLDGPAIPSPPLTLSPSSKMAVVDTLNFELGALNSSSDQNWMAFF